MLSNISGFVLEIDDTSGVINRITQANLSVGVGDRVVSNGRIHAFKGKLGRVVRINYPYTAGNSSDVIIVRWDGDLGEKSMKLKDLMFISSLDTSEIKKVS